MPRSAAALEVERAVLVLKKQREAEQAQAQALVELIRQSTSNEIGRRIDVYA